MEKTKVPIDPKIHPLGYRRGMELEHVFNSYDFDPLAKDPESTTKAEVYKVLHYYDIYLSQLTSDYYKLVDKAIKPTIKQEAEEDALFDLRISLNINMLGGYLQIIKLLKLLGITPLVIGSVIERRLKGENLHDTIHFNGALLRTALSYGLHILLHHYNITHNRIEAVNLDTKIGYRDPDRVFTAGRYASLHSIGLLKILAFDNVATASTIIQVMEPNVIEAHPEGLPNVLTDMLISYSTLSSFLDFGVDSLVPLFLANMHE